MDGKSFKSAGKLFQLVIRFSLDFCFSFRSGLQGSQGVPSFVIEIMCVLCSSQKLSLDKTNEPPPTIKPTTLTQAHLLQENTYTHICDKVSFPLQKCFHVESIDRISKSKCLFDGETQ